jgi:hypothetical protein
MYQKQTIYTIFHDISWFAIEYYIEICLEIWNKLNKITSILLAGKNYTKKI